MAEILSPGVFIEEVTTGGQIVEAVGTSTMAIPGFTLQGPVDEATLVTSPESFSRKFGGFTNDSLVPLSVSAFFANGGTRAYVVRIVPSDAVAATSAIPGAIEDESYGTGTGATPITLAYTTTYRPTAGSIVVSWTKAGTAVVAENPVFAPAEDGAALGPFTATLANTSITNDLVTLDWLQATVAKTATLNSSNVVGGADAANISSATLNRSTGVLVITFAGGNAPDTNSITVDYTPVGAAATVTDDGVGAFTAAGVAGTANYVSGALSITWTGATIVPYNGNAITVDYTGNQWNLTADNEGAWGNSLKLRVKGNDNFFVYGTSTTTDVGEWTKFDVLVFLKNADTELFELKETFEEVVFNDADDAMYFPDVLNDSSDLVTVTDLGFLDVPDTFKGIIRSAVSMGSPNGSLTTFTGTLANFPIVKTSLVVTYTQGAVVRTATTNSAGVISGTGIDSTKTNTVNFDTGAFTLNFSTAPDNLTTLTGTYVSYPETSEVDYLFEDGADGTVSSLGRTDITSPALQASKRGMYALDRIDEMMQLIIPDFAGDATIAGDQIDYCEDRRDVFAILSTPSGMDAQEAADYIRITLNRKSKYSAMYWPWIKVADPLRDNRSLTIPPLAHMAGIYSRTDNSRNVGKAPGGTVDGALRYLIGLETNPDKGDRDTVYQARVNPMINTPQTGMAVWGVRTMSADTNFRYVNATRLFMFVEKSVFNSTHHVIFENITTSLYTQIKTQLDSFLLNLFNTGHFAGSTPSQAFLVVVDSSNNPPEVVNSGQVVVDVGIAPNTPGEFLILKFSRKSLV